jgi:hypothetical protein
MPTLRGTVQLRGFCVFKDETPGGSRAFSPFSGI